MTKNEMINEFFHEIEVETNINEARKAYAEGREII